MADYLHSLEKNMKECISFYQHDISKIRVGRPNPIMVADAKVKAYGQKTKLSHLATINVKGNNSLIVTPFDTNINKHITEALTNLNIDFDISKSVNEIQLIFPVISEETRHGFVKTLKTMHEQCKVKLRNIRRKTIKQMKKDESVNHVPEKKIQAMIDKYVAESDTLTAKKTENLLNF